MFVGDLLALPGRIAGMAGDLRQVRLTVEPQYRTIEEVDARLEVLQAEIAGLRESLARVEGAVERGIEKLPDVDAGPLARAREALTGD